MGMNGNQEDLDGFKKKFGEGAQQDFMALELMLHFWPLTMN